MLDKEAKQFSDQTLVQLKKGLLTYYILLVTTQPIYTSDIIARLAKAGLAVVEGTIYPLLSRLGREGLLTHEWRESTQGPPRKYYHLTELGQIALDQLKQQITLLNEVSQNLEQEEQSHE